VDALAPEDLAVTRTLEFVSLPQLTVLVAELTHQIVDDSLMRFELKVEFCGTIVEIEFVVARRGYGFA